MGYDPADRVNSVIKNAESITSTPTKMSPVRNNIEQQQRHDIRTGTPIRNGNEVTKQNSNPTSGNSSNMSQTMELSKEEKLRKFLESQQLQKRSNAASSEVQNVVTNSTSMQSKKRYGAGAIEEIRKICDHFKDSTNNESTNSAVRLNIQLSSRGRVDLFGSFICTEDGDARQLSDRYDFFDTNSQGEIILPQPQPIFPDEFPDHIPTHSASWWGIVEPTLGIGKYRSHQPPTNHNAMASATKDQGKERNQNDGVANLGINASKSGGPNSSFTTEMKSGNRHERSGFNMEVDRRYNTSSDRFPMANTARYSNNHDQRKERPSNHGNNQEMSMSRQHGRR
jgi:hypothetical protein